MSRCYLSVSGIGLRIDSDEVLAAEGSCEPFLTEPAEPDVCAEFRCVDRLPFEPIEEIWQDIVWRICRVKSGETVRFFYEDRKSMVPYACASWDEERRNIYIAYLSRERSRFRSVMNCFFYIGLEQILVRHERIWPHASCVETEFGGILFSGVSGIGKSTQAGLWCRYRDARQINGDRPILSGGEQGWLAWGAPYAGSSRCYVNESCPVRAIVILRQAKDCSLRRLNPMGAFREVWKVLVHQSWDREYLERLSNLAMDLITRVPVYLFECTPNEQAVRCLEEELRKEAM